MDAAKKHIIDQLKNDILALQGHKACAGDVYLDALPNVMNHAFPNGSFPVAAVHEFIAKGSENTTATFGFIAGLLGSIMNNNGISIWIGTSQTIFPPALKLFGIQPDKIIFIHLKKENEILWVMEEALKCKGLSAVIGEIKDLNFTASRRLQLSIEQSHVTGFIIRKDPHNLNTNACFSRWQITSLPSELKANMPGVGFPRWNVELLKIRNGRPGTWQIEFTLGRFTYISKMAAIPQQEQKKTG